MHKRTPVRLLLAIAITCSLMLTSCDSSSGSLANNQPGTVSGALQGSVLDQNGKGIANAVIWLRSTGQSVRTDAKGAWSLQKQSALARAIVAPRTSETIDSVIISKDSQYITSQPVVKYDAELPPLYIVQRDLYGGLALPKTAVSYAVTGYLTLSDSSAKTIPLWHNAVARSFSGFIYTVYTGNVENYSVRVVVRNAADSQVTGLSPTVPFTSLAGDVQIPVFGYENITPVVATTLSGTVAVGNSVTLNTVVGDTDVVNGLLSVDSISNTISWKHGVAGNWTAGSKSKSVKLDTAILRDSCYFVRVTDNQDDLVTENKYCFDLSATQLVSTSAAAWTWSANDLYKSETVIKTNDTAYLVKSDSCATLSWGYDSVKFGNTYALGGQVRPGDTIDIGVLDRTNRINVTQFESYVGVIGKSAYNETTSSFISSKKALSYFHLDSTGLVGSKLTKLVLWSEKAATINFFGDTVSVVAGDNVLFSNKVVTDTSYISLRLLPNFKVSKRFTVKNGVRYSEYLDGVVNGTYAWNYGNYLLGHFDLSAMPGTYGGGKLLRNNSNANDGKFIVKSLVGYK